MATAPAKGLGKGLSALMSEEYSKTASLNPSPPSNGEPLAMSVDEIISGKAQPRYRFTEEYLEELSESIRRNGIMQPIVIRRAPNDPSKYEIIAGERRWRAGKMAGLSEVPVIIRDINDQQALELALVENIQRQDLTPLEEAAGYQRLIDEFSYTQEELGKSVGKSRSHVANLLRLLSLPSSIKTYLDNGNLTMGHARALLNAPEPEAMAEEVVKRNLNVRQTENLCRVPLPKNKTPSRKAPNNANQFAAQDGDKDPDILALEQTLSENLGLNVSINDRGQDGQIIISYDSLNQLDEVLRRLSGSI